MKRLLAELLFFKITNNCFPGVPEKASPSHLLPGTWQSTSDCPLLALFQRTRSVQSITIAIILLVIKGRMEKLPLPSTPTTSSLICQAWAEGKFPVNDLRPAPYGAPRSTSSSSVWEEKTQVRLFVNSQQMASSSFISLVAKRRFFVPLLYVLCARGFCGAAHRMHF